MMGISWTDNFTVDHFANADYTNLGSTVDDVDFSVGGGTLQTLPMGNGNSSSYALVWEDQRNPLSELPLVMSLTADNLLSTVPSGCAVAFVSATFDAVILFGFSLGSNGTQNVPATSGFAWQISFNSNVASLQGDSTLDWTWGGGAADAGGSSVTFTFGIDATGLLTIQTTDGFNYSYDLNTDIPGFVAAFNSFIPSDPLFPLVELSYS